MTRRASTAGCEPSLGTIFAAFLGLGATSFGGGTAGWIHHRFVLGRRWLDDRTFLADLALAQIMPGSTGVNLTVETGQRLRGAPGALVALIGLLSGPLAIVVGLTALYARLAGIGWVHAALDGVAAGAIGLTFATGLRTLRGTGGSASALAVAAVTVLCVGVLRWPMLPVLLCLAPISIGIAFFERRGRHG
jgi:chromate transporter